MITKTVVISPQYENQTGLPCLDFKSLKGKIKQLEGGRH